MSAKGQRLLPYEDALLRRKSSIRTVRWTTLVLAAVVLIVTVFDEIRRFAYETTHQIPIGESGSDSDQITYCLAFVVIMLLISGQQKLKLRHIDSIEHYRSGK